MSLPEAAVVLAADDARALAGFYAAFSRSRPQPRQRGRLAVCLRRDGDAPVLEAWMDQAIALGGQRLDAPRQEAFGSEVWLLDPEGNALLLLVRDS